MSFSTFRFSLRRLLLLAMVLPLVVGTAQVYRDFQKQYYVTSVSWSPDGKLIAASVVEFQKELRSQKSSWNFLENLVPQTGSVISKVNLQRCVIIDVEKQAIQQELYSSPTLFKEMHNVPFSLSGKKISFSPDGKLVAVSLLSGGVRLWDTKTGSRLNKKDWLTEVENTSIAISYDSRFLAIGGLSACTLVDLKKNYILTNLKQYEGLLGNHGTTSLPLSFSPAKNRLALATNNASVLLYNIDNTLGVSPRPIPVGPITTEVSFLGEDYLVVAYAATKYGISLINIQNQREERFVSTGEEIVWSMTCDSTNKKIVAVGPRLGMIKTSLQNRAIKKNEATSMKLSCVAFSPDAQRLATGGGDGKVRVWDASNLKPQFSLDITQSQTTLKSILLLVMTLLWILGWKFSRIKRK